MSEKMRAIVFTGPRALEVRELERPEPAEGEALIRVKACNICTTEQGQYLGSRPARYPIIGGHELGGVVEAINGPADGLRVGDHVSLGYVYCGTCEACKRGLYTSCAELSRDDVRYGGYRGFFGFADYLTAPIRTIYHFQEDLPFEQIGFEEPLGTVVHGQKKLGIRPGDFIVVFGAGTMGLLNAIYAKAQGAQVMVVDMQEARLEQARRAGIPITVNGGERDAAAEARRLTNGAGADAAILAVGSTAANNQAVEAVRNQGKVLFFAAGYPKPGLDVDPNTLHYSEKHLIGTYGADPEDFVRGNRLLDGGIVDVSTLLDGAYDVLEAKEAFERAVDGSCYRITITF